MEVCGVVIFFLLSGFLISLSVFQKHAEPTYDFRAFFIDRFCRIYAAYLPALIFIACLDRYIADSPLYSGPNTINDGNHFDLLTWIGNLFMLQDFPLFQVARRLGAQEHSWFFGPFGSAGSLWTISIEWWIYMLFGTLVFFILRARKPLSIKGWIVLALIAIEPAYHFVGGPDQCLTMLWCIGMAVSLFFLALPKLAASWSITPRRWQYICYGISAGSLLMLAAHTCANLYHRHDANIAGLQFGVFIASAIFSLLFALGTLEAAPKIPAKIIGFIASYSYSLYLTHLTVLWYLHIRFPGHENDNLFFWLSIALCNAIAIVFWWLFERHYHTYAVRLKAYFHAKKSHV
jgi:peptidoglycan/LPS O-acetylase OafA/YrhL